MKIVNTLFFLCLFTYTYCFSQNHLERIELVHSNSIIIGNTIRITIQPIKKIKNSKMRVAVESKNEYYNRKLSRREYETIKDAVLKIDSKVLYPLSDNAKDTLVTTCLDGDGTSITIFRNNKKENYFAYCFSKMDKYNHKKYFYHAAKLIYQAGRVKIEELDD
ncbi:hypothetical protein SAMN05421857_2028 [Chryseobacterium formosense]|nr:hypothetical protein SAMN05421857_2028 [Chryseobacterium formosense]